MHAKMLAFALCLTMWPHAVSLRGATSEVYRVTARYTVGGTGSYDYLRLDPSTRRLFVSHQTRMEVIDADTGKVLGAITGLKGAHGIALANDLGRGFISNGLNGAVTVIDLASLKTVQTIQTPGQKPDAIEYDPVTKLVVVSNGHSNNETIIDGATGAIVRVIVLAGNPESIAFDGRGNALVNLESHNSVARIEMATGKVTADWPLGPGEGPTGIAIDSANRRLFVSCGGNERLIVLDADSGREVAALPIGDDSDAAGYDPVTHHVYSSNRDGTLTVIQQDDADHYQVEATVETQFGAKTHTVDTARNRIYLPVAKFGPGSEDKPGPVLPNTFEILVVGQ